MLDYFTSNTTIELVCLSIALIFLIGDKSIIWKLSILYLLITCSIELYGIYLKLNDKENGWIYNISIIFEALYISSMFYILFSKYFNSKPILFSGLTLFGIIYCWEIGNPQIISIIHERDGGFNDFTNIFMSILFAVYSFYYFLLLLRDDEYINLTNSANFWWAAGTLCYYFGSSIINILRIIPHPPRYRFLAYVLPALNWIIYSFWSYSFICKRWIRASGN